MDGPVCVRATRTGRQDKSRKDPPIYGSGPPTVPQTGSLWYLIKPNHSPLLRGSRLSAPSGARQAGRLMRWGVSTPIRRKAACLRLERNRGNNPGVRLQLPGMSRQAQLQHTQKPRASFSAVFLSSRRKDASTDEGLKGWSRHSCLLTFINPKPHNPLSGHTATRRRLSIWTMQGAICRITCAGQTGMSAPPSDRLIQMPDYRSNATLRFGHVERKTGQ